MKNRSKLGGSPSPSLQGRGAKIEAFMDIFPLQSRTIRLIGHDVLSRSATDDLFLNCARRIAVHKPATVLLSGGNLTSDDTNRASLLAWDPFLVFTSKNGHCTLQTRTESFTLETHPLDLLDAIIAAQNPGFPLVSAPFSGGAMGYLAYDLKNCIEDLPRSAKDDLKLPDLFLFWPGQLLVHDRREKTLVHLLMAPEGDPLPAGAPPILSETCPSSPTPSFHTGPIASNFSHEGYLRAIQQVRHYIREGDVYQVNLAQRFGFPFSGDPFGLWQKLFALNPAPFYAFINAGDHHVLSTSMERFLLRRGDLMETRPIKGTRKRGVTPDEDARLVHNLENDPKDDAELSMIVDLMRNDLGRVCDTGSVRVAEHKRLETYQNVHHLISIVTGELRPETTPGALLRATFPGGSITGCPKIRAMEIIDELEPHVRHIYTGSIGYLGWHGNLDLNIAIRTAIIQNGMGYYAAGGGIVFDSREQDEYEETLHKARTLFQCVGKTVEETA